MNEKLILNNRELSIIILALEDRMDALYDGDTEKEEIKKLLCYLEAKLPTNKEVKNGNG